MRCAQNASRKIDEVMRKICRKTSVERLCGQVLNESLIPKELTALIEAREAFAAGNLSQAEYEQAVSKYMYSLHGREMWTEAAESLRKQLEECPDNMKKYIGYELKSIDKSGKTVYNI